MVGRFSLRRGITGRGMMAISARAWFWSVLVAAVVLASVNADDVGAEETPSAVLTLDSSNFEETIAKHSFITVEFYAPWCGHCKKLEPEFEKAASELSKHDPPIVLAKVDASDEVNKEIASTFEIKGFPTLRIIRNYGKNIQEYKGPRDADGIVEYLKKQAGPASTEIKSLEDVANLFDDKKVFIVGVFPEYSGEEFENFTAVAEELRSDYDFGHTSNAELLHRGDISVKGPIIRLFKPFDELFVDFQDFHRDALESFIETASVPVVTTFNSDPINHPFVTKFFNNQNSKVMLFINFSEQYFDSFKSKYYEIAENHKDKAISFLLGDLEASKGAFQYFGLKEDQAPLILLQENDAKKFLKPNIEPDQIATWLKEYLDGNLPPFVKSEPIPEVNNEPVKVVVANSVHDVVFKSGKNVLLEFYAPWCGHCKKLAPILEEVAVSFQHDDDIIIAKMDATANDVPNEFEVQGYPTIYFSSANGKLLKYEEGRTAEDFIDFIKKNRHTVAESIETDFIKDEL